MICRIIIWLLHRKYIKYGMPIYYIKGTGKAYPIYMLYTEDINVYKRMDEF